MLNSDYQTIDQILQLFNNMLNILQVPYEVQSTNLQPLYNEKIYIQIANILFPFLQYNLLQIQKKKEDSGQKLEKLIRLLEQDIVKRDLSHIKGKDITKKNLKSIYEFVVILFQLTKRHVNNFNQQQENDENQSQSNSQTIHSVLGIENQFEKDQDYQQEQSLRKSIHEVKNEMEQKNIPKSENKKHENLIMNNKLIEHQVNQLRIQQKQKQKGLKYEPKKSEEISDNYGDILERKNKQQNNKKNIKHYKSNKSIKQTIKKNIQNQLFHQKTNKKLTTECKLKKVTSAEKLSKAQKQFNELAFANIKSVRQKMKSHEPQMKITDKISQNQINKKKKQLKHAVKALKQKKSIKQNMKKHSNYLALKNEQKRIKMLKIKKQQLKKQAKNEEFALDMKLRDQKFRYVKKINHIVEKLEKDKNITEKKQFREKLLLQNKLTSNKLQALQNQYKTQINLLKQKEVEQRKQRRVIESAHKQIIGKLEKQLKRESENKIVKIQQRYKQQYNKLLDLTNIEDQLIKLYKKY